MSQYESKMGCKYFTLTWCEVWNSRHKYSLSQHQCLCLALHLADRDPALPHLTACYLTSSCTGEPLITAPPAFRSTPATRLLERSKITHQSERLFNTACPDKVASLSHEIKTEREKVEEPFHSRRVHRHHYHHWHRMHVTAQHRHPQPNTTLTPRVEVSNRVWREPRITFEWDKITLQE